MGLIHHFFALALALSAPLSQAQRFKRLDTLLGACHMYTETFDTCMQDVFNDLRVFFKNGIPEFNIKPFDPHKAAYVEQRRGDLHGIGGYDLILKNVSEFGWSNSKVTKFKSDLDNNQIEYSQFFPEKSLEGTYEFSGKLMGAAVENAGIWNLTLYNYSQTTTVRRLGGPGSILKVHVEVDKIGGMTLHISDFFGSRAVHLNNIADTVINSMWKAGLPFLKPLINELVSTAFTDIFNESFRYFPISNFVK
ncbi:unnamed protein product [Hermetia illucens]|uniref:Circadian clock-controlled protein n=1 Tax=Hermetia illucens TaxID=343691 RepID=A0A7R8Z3K5_HERIL|nr:uncharacterized protein LOC119659364 [Hermetia illucens]XP_037923345.1 uncharacterized protein LOC119659364 [Hermetia illucens]XP_037923346.1 uncharacterized protein LOC119659364 [Hermetia illucens]XP_037923347.1 uncharacterized protein LOC119659364 [Hermetia illucens]CAD7092072.1 unnamed protein product [Hermetia illucens]